MLEVGFVKEEISNGISIVTMASSIIIYLSKCIKSKILRLEVWKCCLIVKVFYWRLSHGTHIDLKFLAFHPFAILLKYWAQHVGLGHWALMGASPFQFHINTFCSSLFFLPHWMCILYFKKIQCYTQWEFKKVFIRSPQEQRSIFKFDKSNLLGLVLTW